MSRGGGGRHPNLLQSLGQVGGGGNSREVGHPLLAMNKLGPGRQVDLWSRMDKKRHRKASLIAPSGVGDPVGGALKDPIGKVLQHIANVDYDLPRGCLNGQPLVICREDF